MAPQLVLWLGLLPNTMLLCNGRPAGNGAISSKPPGAKASPDARHMRGPGRATRARVHNKKGKAPAGAGKRKLKAGAARRRREKQKEREQMANAVPM